MYSFLVSIKDLYLRLENARIDAEVTTYLASHEPVDEFSEEGQKFIGGMISNSDPENMQTLKKRQAQGTAKFDHLFRGTFFNWTKHLAVSTLSDTVKIREIRSDFGQI